MDQPKKRSPPLVDAGYRRVVVIPERGREREIPRDGDRSGRSLGWVSVRVIPRGWTERKWRGGGCGSSRLQPGLGQCVCLRQDTANVAELGLAGGKGWRRIEDSWRLAGDTDVHSRSAPLLHGIVLRSAGNVQWHLGQNVKSVSGLSGLERSWDDVGPERCD